MPPPRIAALIACCWLGSSGVGCASDAAEPVAVPIAVPLAVPLAAAADASALLREIERQIGDAVCDADAQCHTLAVGAKACGGPEAYLAWSDKVSRAAPLTELAARHRTERERENLRNRLQSNCALLADPGAICRPRPSDARQVCQPRPGGRGDPR